AGAAHGRGRAGTRTRSRCYRAASLVAIWTSVVHYHTERSSRRNPRRGDMVRAMRLGSQPWLRGGFLASALGFIGIAVYLYAFRFFDWLESDAAVPALLAAKVLDTGSPIALDWYSANGDLWLVAQHLIAVLPVAIFGVGPASLLVANVLGFLIEAFILV